MRDCSENKVFAFGYNSCILIRENGNIGLSGDENENS